MTNTERVDSDGDENAAVPESSGDTIGSALANLARRLWRDARDQDDPAWPPRWLVTAAVTVGLALAVAVILGLGVPLLRGLAGVSEGLGGEDGRGVARVVLDPVRAYLDGHADRLPSSPGTLRWVWALFGLVMLVLATVGLTGARVGWALFGAATAGMAWSATPRPAEWVAVGVTAAWWSLLAVPAYRRRRPRTPWPVPRRDLGPGQADGAADTGPRAAEPRDEVAAVAAVYEMLVRRRRACDVVLARRGPTWTVTGNGRSFTATDTTGRRVTGTAATTEYVAELLATLSNPPGATPTVRWITAVPPAPDRLAIEWQDRHYDLPDLRKYLQGTPKQLGQVSTALRAVRSDWDLDRLAEQITARAAALDESHPLIHPHAYIPDADRDGYLGDVTLNDWVDTATIVQATRSHWNDFAEHRPEMVELIVRKLLTADDLETAVLDILTDDDHVHLDRFHGPAGPIHKVSVNGGHRTHALRFLDVPLIAAEVTPRQLPLRLKQTDIWVAGFTGPVEPLWRGLIHRGLLVADLTPGDFGPVLEPHYVLAPWLLLDPRTAVQISAAYDRVYPGALADAGIPASALRTASTWQRWLAAAVTD